MTNKITIINIDLLKSITEKDYDKVDKVILNEIISDELIYKINKFTNIRSLYAFIESNETWTLYSQIQ